MRPGVPHIVIGIGNNISFGAHYISTSNIVETIVQSLHGVVCGRKFTNADHGEEFVALLQRLLCMWTGHYINASDGSYPIDQHMPIFSEWSGVHKFIMLANYLLLWPSLHIGVYAGEDAQVAEDCMLEDDERYHKKVDIQYRYMKGEIKAQFQLLLNGRVYDWEQMFWVSLSQHKYYLANGEQESLIHMAACVLREKAIMDGDQGFKPTKKAKQDFTYETFKQSLLQVLDTYNPPFEDAATLDRVYEELGQKTHILYDVWGNGRWSIGSKWL